MAVKSRNIQLKTYRLSILVWQQQSYTITNTVMLEAEGQGPIEVSSSIVF
jgi:hypothetical protein